MPVRVCARAGRRTANPFGASEPDASGAVVDETDDAKDASSKSRCNQDVEFGSEHASQRGHVGDIKAPGKVHMDDAMKTNEKLAEQHAREESRLQEEKRALMEADALMHAHAPPRVPQKSVSAAPKNEGVSSREAANNVREGALHAQDPSQSSRSSPKKMAPMMSPFLSENIHAYRIRLIQLSTCCAFLALSVLCQHIQSGLGIILCCSIMISIDMVKQKDFWHRETKVEGCHTHIKEV